MLEYIREHSQGWFAWAIIILLIIPFALWGIHQYVDGDSAVNVAVVNGKEISANQFQRTYQQTYQQQRNRLQNMLGDRFDPSFIDQDQLKKNVLENMIEREVLVQSAHDEGMRVSALRVGAEIRGIPSVQSDGKFDKVLYGRLLQSQGISVGAFERMVGDDIIIQQLSRALADGGFVTKAELDALLRIRLQQRDIGYALVPVANYISEVAVDDKDVEKFYKDNPDRFRTPEQVSVDYLELSSDEMAKGIKVTEADLHSYYQERAADFTTPEQRRARHILIPVASDAPPAEVEAAKKKAEDLLARIRKGESFAELAKKFSQDPGSAKQGGDLGFFGRGVMDKAFEDAAFSLKVGEVSEPVRSTFGFHIIKLEGKRGGERKPFKEVRTQLEKDLKHQRAADRYFSQAEELSNLAFEHDDSLIDVAKQMHLTIKNSGLFTHDSGTGIAADPKVREAAFSDDVLLGGKNSEAIELSQDHLVVLHLKEHKPVALRPLKDVREDIRQKLRIRDAKSKAKKVGEGIMRRIKGGEKVAAVTAELKLKWERPGFVKRKGSKVSSQIVDAVFKLDQPADAKPVFGGKPLSTGDFAVYGLYAVKEGDPASADKKTVETVKKSLEREHGQIVFKDYTDALKANMKITRFPNNI